MVSRGQKILDILAARKKSSVADEFETKQTLQIGAVNKSTEVRQSTWSLSTINYQGAIPCRIFFIDLETKCA